MANLASFPASPPPRRAAPDPGHAEPGDIVARLLESVRRAAYDQGRADEALARQERPALTLIPGGAA